MAAEGRNVNKYLYKLELYLIKVIPTWIALFYFFNTTLSYLGKDWPIISLISGLSLLPWVFLYLSSFVFRFCIWHRLPLYYVLISDALAYYDMYFGLPLSYRSLFSLHCIIAGLFMVLTAYFKNKHERRDY